MMNRRYDLFKQDHRRGSMPFSIKGCACGHSLPHPADNHPCGCNHGLSNVKDPCKPAVPPKDEGVCSCHEPQEDGQRLLKQIQVVDFALYEVILYLDAYPESSEALDYYHKLMERRRALHTRYEGSCGPITAYGNVSRNSWDWVKGPAPWEYAGS